MTRHGTFRNDEWSCVDAMAAGELSRLGIAEAAYRLRCGELTAGDYATALLERQHLGRRRMRMRSSGSNQTVRLKRPARRMREESGGRAWHYCMACLLHSRTTSTSREPAYNGLQTGSVDLAIGECAACPETLFAHHGVAAIIVSTTPRPAGLIGTDDDQILINGELLSTFSTFIRNTSPAAGACGWRRQSPSAAAPASSWCATRNHRLLMCTSSRIAASHPAIGGRRWWASADLLGWPPRLQYWIFTSSICSSLSSLS